MSSKHAQYDFLLKMKYYQLLAVILLVNAVSTAKQTTKFWETQLQHFVDYQVFSGYQEIDWYYAKGTSGMFYNLFSAQGHNITDKAPDLPLIIWLQGGPGLSSQFGAFAEMGPIRIAKGQPLNFPFPWNYLGHIIFVDSPLNVGFSYQGDRKGKTQVSTVDQATDHLLNFLQNLYSEFPSLKSCPLFIAGESFAGHYIPNWAKKILTNTTFQAFSGVKLAGISIGGGWVDPLNQINFYDSYLSSVGVISNKFKESCLEYQTNAMINIYNENYEKATDFLTVITNNATTREVYMGNISLFNFRSYDDVDYSFAEFLNKNKGEIGATAEFILNNDQVFTAFKAEISKSFATDLSFVVQKTKVLIYNGQNDATVNTPGVLQYLNNLSWGGMAEWKKKEKKIWKFNQQWLGWAKVSGNLWFVFLNKAGHLTSVDQPLSTFRAFGHFIRNDDEWTN